ncbi:NACHT domain-containing protein [Streptomyces scopuliridis]|uniref:NACHT domain-containing protein n=1 Tax=Streptomyces scopuliridis TaxID=452529 RepID=UPI002DDC1113|nr:NACHT domain-containing protein [Streptomyces scopuliridis]WSB34308.1 NACHT domain-containing protein [Streptomyces scopuliridis]
MSAARVVAVRGQTQGTGVLLTPRLVLTCAHVVGDDDRPMIAHPDRAGQVTSEVQWRDESLDTALLFTEHDLIDAERAAPLGRLRIGALATTSPLPHCQIVGFPDIQRYGDDGALELDQYRASVLPSAGALRSVLVCELDHPPATERHDGTSPLQGLSGSPVFAGPVLLGIVTRVPRGRGHLRVEGIPMDRILATDVFLDSFRSEPVTDFHPGDQRFEEQYARALRARYRKTRIFGIDELGTHETSWDLDTAYLSLEAGQRDELAPDPRVPFRSAPAQPRRIDDLLADRPRTLLRGEAGAGKTTLVWWLASHAACGTLDPELADLNGLVPFVVPLRTLHARGTDLADLDQLHTAAQIPAGRAPDGWASRVLASGRALLLVDGIDEVPPAEREKVRTWLTELLDLYPGTRCLTTVRPLAVEQDWLRSEGFEELHLLPMRDEDIQVFVTAWHRAARRECDGYPDTARAAAEQAELHELEAELRTRFRQNASLLALAQTPLLCAVICALHRRRRGLLPDTRWDLYRSTLAMLLGSRDSQREIGRPEGISMGLEEHQELLQSVAIWLVRAGQTQLSHQDAERQIEVAMRRLPQVSAQGPAATVLTHLLNRSGLLQERGDRAVQFIHRTFQDYLSARAFIEGGSLMELLQNAHDERWHDTILLAVGHCRPHEIRGLIGGLLAAGEAASDRTRREELYVLAARCFLNAVVVDETVAEEVAAHVRAILPPHPMAPEETLVSLGPYVLPFLPGPADVDSVTAERVARLICEIGGPEAIPFARRYALHESVSVRSQFAMSWSRFPAVEYAREVLARMPLADTTLVATGADQLRHLRELPAVESLGLTGSCDGAQLRTFLPGVDLRDLHVRSNKTLDELSFLRELPRLNALGLSGCSALKDLSGLRESRIEVLRMDVGRLTHADLSPIHQMPKLTGLRVIYGDSPLAQQLPTAHPEVESLIVECDKPIDFSSLPEWSSLQFLSLSFGSCAWLVHSGRSMAPARQVRNLRVRVRSGYAGLAHLAEIFPALSLLEITTEVPESRELDLTALQSLRGLRVDIVSLRHAVPPTVVGGEPFGDRLTVRG